MGHGEQISDLKRYCGEPRMEKPLLKYEDFIAILNRLDRIEALLHQLVENTEQPTPGGD